MIINCVIGQAGSGKSTFIGQKFPRDQYIFFDVGDILRGMFTCFKGNQGNKNVWSFANPLVYSIMKKCVSISSKTNYPVVFDGFPRNSTQVRHLHRYLTSPRLGKVEVLVHCLDINMDEQMSRIEKRNGGLDEYQIKRIKQSRNDFEGVIEEVEKLMLDSRNHPVSYKCMWYKQVDDGFTLEQPRR